MEKNEHINQIELRSEEVQEILTRVPNWMIRWGNTLFLSLIIMLLLLSWFVKYPDIVEGKVIITTETSPVKLVSKESGKITHLNKAEHESVAIGESILLIENTLSFEAKSHLDTLKDEVIEFLFDYTTQPNFNNQLTFGNIQNTYNDLNVLSNDYYTYMLHNYGKKQLDNIQLQINQYKRLIAIGDSKERINRQELFNAQKKHQADKSLYSKGVLSKMDFFKEESAFHQKQENLENSKSSSTQNRITLAQLKQQKLAIEEETANKERSFKEGIQGKLNSIENEIRQWEQSYSLSAPIDGKISYLKQLSINKNVLQGEELIAIVPENSEIIGVLYLPQQGIGKVKIGQRVMIRLTNFPYQEFGVIEANITLLSLIANEEVYRVEVSLANGLNSSYNKQIAFTPEMEGTAEVITEDLRLIERIFNQFNTILKR